MPDQKNVMRTEGPKDKKKSKENPKEGSKTTVVKDENGGRSTRTVSTSTTPGTPNVVIKGTPGTPAELPSKGIKGGDDFNKAFGKARAAGKEVFTYNGKLYKVQMSGTKGKPAVPPTPDIVKPGIPPKTVTKVEEKPIQSGVYKVDAKRGTIGGKTRDGIGGGITTKSQITSNKEVADRAVESQENYNTYIDKKYAPNTTNERGLNPEQLKLKNEKAAKRRLELKGSTDVSLTPVQSGLERKKTEELRKRNTSSQY